MLQSLLLSTMLLSVNAHAQEVEGMDLNALPSPIFATPFFGLRGSQKATAGTVSLGFRTSYVAKALSIRTPSPAPEGYETAVVNGTIITELVASTSFNSGLDLGIGIGAHLFQWGPGVAPNTGGDLSLPSFGARDPRLEVGWSFGKKQLSLRPYIGITLPLGSASAFAGEEHFRGELGAALGGTHDKIQWGAQAGLRYRSPIELSSTIWGSQAHLAGAIYYFITPELLVGPEFHLLPVLHSQPTTAEGSGSLLIPAEVSGSLRYQKNTWSIGVSAGTGLPLSRASANTGGDFVRGPTSPLFRGLVEFRVTI